MEKIKSVVALVVICFLSHGLRAYVKPSSGVFGPNFLITYEKKTNGSNSRVIAINNAEQFQSLVINNKRPTVVKIFSVKQENGNFITKMYQELAEEFKDIVFVGLNIADNENVIRAIMVKLGKTEVSLPMFVFFKNGTLMYPQVATREQLHQSIKRYLCTQDGLAFVQSQPVCVQFAQVQTKKTEKEDMSMQSIALNENNEELSTFDKLKKVLFGVQNLSEEVKAYHQSRRWKQRREIERLS